MMNFLSTYGKEIVSLLVPFITWLLNANQKGKAKLVWTNPHSFVYLIKEQSIDANGNVMVDASGNAITTNKRVSTSSIKVINQGRETATNVELVFNWKPQYINLWPIRHYVEKTDQDGRHFLIFENLSPKETLGVEIMTVGNDLPAVVQVRSAECTAINMPLMWIPTVAAWKIAVARLLMFIGLSASVYFAIQLLQFLILKTP